MTPPAACASMARRDREYGDFDSGRARNRDFHVRGRAMGRGTPQGGGNPGEPGCLDSGEIRARMPQPAEGSNP